MLREGILDNAGKAVTNALNTMRGLVPKGAVSGNEYTLGIDGKDYGYNFTGDDLTEVGMAQFRDRNNIQANLGGGMDALSQREIEATNRSLLAGVGMQNHNDWVSDVDTRFAQALSKLTSREQAEIISATQGYNDEQVENFKRQYLKGNVSSYELGAQSNLGF